MTRARAGPLSWYAAPPPGLFYTDILLRASLKDTDVSLWDHIGFGLSDKPGDWSYLPQDHAQNVGSLIETLGLEDITLVVHDFGGPIGLSYAINNPEKVAKLILFNTFMWATRGELRFQLGGRFVGSLVGRFLYKYFSFSTNVIPKSIGSKLGSDGNSGHQTFQAASNPA